MRAFAPVTAVLICLAMGFGEVRADTPAAPADLVQQVQAANLLADLITFTVDRADTRLKEAQGFLSSIGKTQDYERARPTVAAPRPLNYMLLFQGSLAFVEGDGAKFADQSVTNEPVSQLYADLTAAQYYNMHEFLHFNQQRQEFASIRAFLQSTGDYDKFLAASGQEGEPAGSGGNIEPASQPVPSTPQEVAQRMGGLIQFIHDTAWKRAQAKGTSREDFEKQWPQEQKAYREAVMAKIEGVQPIESAFGQTQVSGTPTAATPVDGAANGGAQTAGASLGPQTITVVQQPDLGDFRQLPPPVPSPYSNAEYRARDRGLWDMWDFNRRY